MEYSERIAIRDFALDYLTWRETPHGGTPRTPSRRSMPSPAPRTPASCPCSSASSTPTPSASEYTCDLTLWYEHLVKEA